MLIEESCLIVAHLEEELRKFLRCLNLLQMKQDVLTHLSKLMKLFLHLRDCLVKAEDSHDTLIESIDGLGI